MGHVVVHRDAQGAWQLEDVASLDAALERVETLRNVEQRDEVRLFDEVALEVRTYYRVALAGGATAADDAPAPQPPAPSAPAALAAVDDPPQVDDEPDADPGHADPGASAGPDAAAEVAPAPQPSWDPGLSPFPAGGASADGAAADTAPGAAAASPPPGTFPLAAPPVPAPSTSEQDHDREATAAGGRRGSRFGRDR